MSAATNAVFLSYAREDTDAAKRIAAALRAAGVEVWFDQSELVGGDAWDQKIRKQIKDCALLLPIISASTQARTEGYFRLEWRLADQRTHLMAKGRPFLLPVVIDDTRDADAHVPDSFTEVQWTRLPGGDASPIFTQRVRALLDGGSGSRETAPPAPASREPGPWVKKLSRRWLGPVLLIAMAVAAFALWQPGKRAQTAPLESKSSPPSPAPMTEARKLANRAQQLLEDPNFTRESSWLADELCERALTLEAGDAEIWAVASLASLNLYWNTYDTSAARREKIGAQAGRALQLDPQSVRAALGAARNLDLNYESEEGLRTLRALHQRAPSDQQVIFHLLRAEGRKGNDVAVQDLLRLLRELPRTGLLPLSQWYEVLRLRNAARYAEAGAILDEMFAGPEPVRGAYYEKLQLLLNSWHDLAEVEPFLEQIPARYRREPAFGSAIAQYWLWRHQPENALQTLALVPQEYFEEYSASEPKALHAGWAHLVAGRAVAAQAEWRNALALVETRLKTDSRNFTLLNQRCGLLALTGQSGAAREAWQLRVELGGQQDRPSLIAEAQVRLALSEPERALVSIEASWRSLSPGAQARVLPVLRFHPAFAAIRDDPRLQRILADGTAMLQRLKAEQTGIAQPPAVAPGPDNKSVAVLAFANLSDDKGNEYFSDGISEELLNVLAKVPGLKVTARTSSFYFKGKEVPIPEIARQLGVAYVVEGSVRKAGDKVRITAQLIKAADGFHVWSDTFTRDLKDIFAVQDEIAGLIAKNLELKMGVTAARPTVDLEAYQGYLTGRAAVEAGTAMSAREGIARFREAVRLDPKFTAAWLQIARTYVHLSRWGGLLTEGDWKEAALAMNRAVALEPNSPDVWLALGWMRRTADWNWRGAEQALREARRQRPDHAETLVALGVLLANLGRLQEAITLAQRAVELDPLNGATQMDLLSIFFSSGRFEEAAQAGRRALQLVPGAQHYHGWLSLSLTELGRFAEAEAEARLEPEPINRLLAQAMTLVRQNRLAEARERLKEIEAKAEILKGAENIYITIAYLSSRMGDMDKTFDALEKARAIRDPSIAWLRTDFFSGSRADPRYAHFLHKFGLADDQLK